MRCPVQKNNTMKTWLKLIGSAKSPITESGFKENYVGFRRIGRPSIQPAEQLFLYAPGGNRRIFALAVAVSYPEHDSDFNPSKEGSCRWKLKIRYEINLPVTSGILIGDVSSHRDLAKALRQASHIELRPEEYQSAKSQLEAKQIPVCVDLPVTSNLLGRVETTISRILRNSPLVATLKKKYNFSCQICGTRLELPNLSYCEAHHIRPLGAPHGGLDEESNLVIVCPNHHVLLDYGAIPFPKDSLVSSLHKINQANIDYHNTTIHKSPDAATGSK